jgi:hypothetical protein
VNLGGGGYYKNKEMIEIKVGLENQSTLYYHFTRLASSAWLPHALHLIISSTSLYDKHYALKRGHGIFTTVFSSEIRK